MKLDETITADLPPRAVRWMQMAAQKVNALASGRFSAVEHALASAPTTGTWAQGDLIRNSNPTDSGSYVIFGWICTVSGTPGTWDVLYIHSNVPAEDASSILAGRVFS